MAKLELKEKINFRGNIMTFEEFIETYAGGNLNDGNTMVEVLIRKGSVKKMDDPTLSPQSQAIKKSNREEIVRMMADEIDLQENVAKDRRVELKNEGRQTYGEIEISYLNVFLAQEAEAFYTEKLRLKDTEVKIKEGVPYLVVRDITDAELSYINRMYKADKTIRTGVDFVGKGADNAIGAVNYTAKKIITPVFEIGARSIMGLLRVVTGTTVKAGSTVVNAGSASIKQTAYELKHDPDTIWARRELTNAKDDICRTLGSKTGGTASGIRVVR